MDTLKKKKTMENEPNVNDQKRRRKSRRENVKVIRGRKHSREGVVKGIINFRVVK